MLNRNLSIFLMFDLNLIFLHRRYHRSSSATNERLRSSNKLGGESFWTRKSWYNTDHQEIQFDVICVILSAILPRLIPAWAYRFRCRVILVILHWNRSWEYDISKCRVVSCENITPVPYISHFSLPFFFQKSKPLNLYEAHTTISFYLPFS